jgi:hypothetical protein
VLSLLHVYSHGSGFRVVWDASRDLLIFLIFMFNMQELLVKLW